MIWPFRRKVKEQKTPELKGVKIAGLFYEPQEDITPHEVALLFPLFQIFVFDRQAYIDKYNLRRHFKETNDE